MAPPDPQATQGVNKKDIQLNMMAHHQTKTNMSSTVQSHQNSQIRLQKQQSSTISTVRNNADLEKILSNVDDSNEIEPIVAD